ncbi:hypothetical protein C8J57DRAFT_1267141 [Mycena rebaudengoi]|nr:hypothetical protein C8J57DRAFT_1267141 [Mycena rebaudengoi]
MELAVQLSTLSISPTSPTIAVQFADYESFGHFFDCVEHGMGLKRGELEAFVESKANVLQMNSDLIDACRDGVLALVPEKEHLIYILKLWQRNRRCKTLDEREVYCPPKASLSQDGQYVYRLWHVPSLRVDGPDGVPTEPGSLRVFSSIPPYVWAVYSSFFATDHIKVLRPSFTLSFVRQICRIARTPTVPRAFLVSGTLHKRPDCWCIEDEEEKKERQRQRFRAWVRRNLPTDEDAEMTEKQRPFLLELIALDVKYD